MCIRDSGYLEGNGYVVSWCVGHLVELAQPEAYDAKYSKWAYACLLYTSVIATTMNGKERLHLMHSMFHMGDNDKFFFDWKYLVESGLSVNCLLYTSQPTMNTA